MPRGYDIYRTILDAHKAFKDANIREGSPDYPIIKEPEKSDDIEGIVYASNLFGCPRKNAIEQLPEDEQMQFVKFPDIWFGTEPSSGMSMMLKADAGRYIQRALQWYGGLRDVPFSTASELRISHPDFPIRGRMDSLLMFSDSTHIVELKVVGGYADVNFNLKKSHVAQTLFYLLAMLKRPEEIQNKAVSAHIATLDITQKDDDKILQLWSLIPSNGGYFVQQHNGDAWRSTINRPEVINEQWIRDEAAKQLNYRANFRELPLPYDDPLSSESLSDGSYGCMKAVDKFPPKSGMALYKPSPYCGAGCYFESGKASLQVPIVNGKPSLREDDIPF